MPTDDKKKQKEDIRKWSVDVERFLPREAPPEVAASLKELIYRNKEFNDGPPDFIQSKDDYDRWEAEVRESVQKNFQTLVDNMGHSQATYVLSSAVRGNEPPDLIPPHGAGDGPWLGGPHDRFYGLNPVLFDPMRVENINPRTEQNDAGPSQDAIRENLNGVYRAPMTEKVAFTQGIRPEQLDTYKNEWNRLNNRRLDDFIRSLGIGGG